LLQSGGREADVLSARCQGRRGAQDAIQLPCAAPIKCPSTPGSTQPQTDPCPADAAGQSLLRPVAAGSTAVTGRPLLASIWPVTPADSPPLVVADLGSGEGLLSELLARRAKRVIAVDNSEKMVTYGPAKLKKRAQELEFRLGTWRIRLWKAALLTWQS